MEVIQNRIQKTLKNLDKRAANIARPEKPSDKDNRAGKEDPVNKHLVKAGHETRRRQEPPACSGIVGDNSTITLEDDGHHDHN